MPRWSLLVVLAACATSPSPPVADCTAHGEQASCAADTSCAWYDASPPCRSDQPSCHGVCQWPAGLVTGDGTASASCSCPTGGICFEQFGGPAEPVYPPAIQCITAPRDSCDGIAGQGRCTASATVRGLCECDNGIR
jgi:hypothetical protein